MTPGLGSVGGGEEGGLAPIPFSPFSALAFSAMMGPDSRDIKLLVSLRSRPVWANIHRDRSCRGPSASKRPRKKGERGPFQVPPRSEFQT